MTNEQKYFFLVDLHNSGGILVTYSHPEGVRCHIGLGWDEDVEEYIQDEYFDGDYLKDEPDFAEIIENIPYQICIWDNCHESDLGIIYCTVDDIEINDNKLTINCKGEHIYGGMSEWSDSDGKLEFEMFVPFSK